MFDAAAGFCGGYAVPLVRQADPTSPFSTKSWAPPNKSIHLTASGLRSCLAAASGCVRLSVRLLSKLKHRADI
jgi:hypothetical protein